MSRYLPKNSYTHEFEGDEVTFTLLPLKRSSFVRVLPAISVVREQTMDQAMAIYTIACEVLDEHIEEVTGLRDANGNAVSKEVFLGDVYFIQLVTLVFNDIIQACSLGKGQSENSGEKLPDAVVGQQ